MKTINYLCKCLDCNIEFTSNNKRHEMTYCPNCNKTAVAIEEFYSRRIGNVVILGEIKDEKI